MTERSARTPAEAMQDEKITLAQEVREHVNNNITDALSGRKCVDGRYAPGTGQIARAGGDMGYVEVLLALNTQKSLGLSPEECFDLIYDYSTKDGGKFFLHTDTHADPEGVDHVHDAKHPLIGCGACAKAADPEFALLYELDPEQVKATVIYARERQAKGDKVEIVKLEGEHAEKGTIIVDSETYSVNASDKDGESQYFIYDKKRDEAYMAELVKWLTKERELTISLEDFLQVSETQTNATLHILAEGTPIIQVAIDDSGNASAPQFLQFTP